MKRNWDVIREILCEVEALKRSNLLPLEYYLLLRETVDTTKVEQAILLFKAGFIEGKAINTLEGLGIDAYALTWRGHDLLDTICNQNIWERVKYTAKEKGIELTFDAVKVLGKHVLESVLKT